MELTYLLPHPTIALAPLVLALPASSLHLCSVQHRHIVLVVVAAATRPPPSPATPGRDGAGGSAEEEKGR